jgi:hypothetical protein
MIVISSGDEDENHRPDSSACKPASRKYLGAAPDTDTDANSEVSDPQPGPSRWTDDEGDGDEDDAFLVDDEGEDANDEEVYRFRQQMSTQIQGIQYHLKTYIQWLVHLIVCPQVDWLEEDANFEASFKMINDTLKSLVQSLIGSSAWRVSANCNFCRACDMPACSLPDHGVFLQSDFQKALDQKPYMSLHDIDILERNGPCGKLSTQVDGHGHWTLKAYLPCFVR